MHNTFCFLPHEDAFIGKHKLTPALPDCWQRHTDTNMHETALPTTHKRIATGCVVIEPDARVWLYEPTNHYDNLWHTFPGGKLEKGLTPQQNARKETLEEMGLNTRIVAHLGDIETFYHYRRYYLALRVGGTPAAMGWEAQSVKLVSLPLAHDLLTSSLDLLLLDWTRNGKRRQYRHMNPVPSHKHPQQSRFC